MFSLHPAALRRAGEPIRYAASRSAAKRSKRASMGKSVC
jgi:hypothetical protein